jgi:anti-anti-sigma factor
MGWGGSTDFGTGACGSAPYVRVERDRTAPECGPATFVVSGELDLGSLDGLLDAIIPIAGESPGIVLDVSGLEFIDCSGVGALEQIAAAIAPRGRLVIRHPSRQVARVLSLTGAVRSEGLVVSE